jgi:hypothetical protein
MSTKRQRNDEIRRLSTRYPRVIVRRSTLTFYGGQSSPLVGPRSAHWMGPSGTPNRAAV